MTEKEIKRKLEDDGFRVIDVARHLAKDFPITVGSAETMLREMIAGRRYFATYAEWLKTNYSVTVNKPEGYKTVRERMKQAA